MTGLEVLMKVELRNNMDFLAGLLMIVVGAGAFYMALSFPYGSALRMGPGYFPRILSCILIGFGVFVLIRGLIRGEAVKGRWGWKPLGLIVLALIGFGWTMENFGFFPALAVLFIVGSLAGYEFKLVEVLLLTVAMSAFAWAVFIYGIGLPYPLFGGH